MCYHVITFAFLENNALALVLSSSVNYKLNCNNRLQKSHNAFHVDKLFPQWICVRIGLTIPIQKWNDTIPRTTIISLNHYNVTLNTLPKVFLLLPIVNELFIYLHIFRYYKKTSSYTINTVRNLETKFQKIPRRLNTLYYVIVIP